jgi:hypothetical protein
MVSLRSVASINNDRITQIFNMAMTSILLKYDVISINRHQYINTAGKGEKNDPK